MNGSRAGTLAEYMLLQNPHPDSEDVNRGDDDHKPGEGGVKHRDMIGNRESP